MKKSFYTSFSKPEKLSNRTVSLSEDLWTQVEAYRLFVSSKVGFEVKFSDLIKNVFESHISNDKEFYPEREEWVCKLSPKQSGVFE